jgi:ABC-type polysaccharide/polyol phosphate transport system ATPase subunit
MSSDIAIKVDHLTKIYKLYESPADRLKEALNPLRRKYHRDFHALSDVSFEIRKGETVGIIGQNGAGKSTLLKMITGVLTPTSGQVRVEGRISALLELGAGFNPDISGMENLYFNGTLQGFSKEQMDAKIEEILAFADIGDFVHQPVKVYSSGMFVRLAFALAVHTEPEILIIDEALSVGDVMFQSKCFDKIKSMMKEGVTTLFVTHNIGNIATLCDRAFLLDSGAIFAEGNPKDVTITYFELQRKREHQARSQQLRKTTVAATEVAADFKSSKTSNEHRFGSQVAQLVDYKILDHNGRETLALETGKEFKIWVRVAFNGEVTNPTVGVMIRNAQGQNLLGIHTYLERGMHLGKKGSGDELSAILESEMLLNPGKYTISIGIADHDTDLEYKSLDSRNNIVGIDVFGKSFSYGLIHNPSRVTVIDQ